MFQEMAFYGVDYVKLIRTGCQKVGAFRQHLQIHELAGTHEGANHSHGAGIRAIKEISNSTVCKTPYTSPNRSGPTNTFQARNSGKRWNVPPKASFDDTPSQSSSTVA